MPPIDPTRLLKTLTPLLDPSSGSIKSDKDVDKLYGLMSKFSKKLVSKCVYLNILRSTEPQILDLFMQRGGWEMVYSWTIDATEHKNFPILTEVLYLLLKTPATIDRLKENELPKLVKNLSRDCEREETKSVALQVYNKWMAIAQNKDVPAEPSPAPPALSTIDSNLISFELQGNHHGQGITLPASMGLQEPTSIVIMEGEHDLTHYIDNTDLTSFETDFNPDVFNSTVDQLDGITTDPGHADAFQVEGMSLTEPQMTPVVATTSVNGQDYCVIEKDGKQFLIKLQMLKPENQLKIDGNVPTTVAEVKTEAKNTRKRPVKKEPTVTKPKMTIGGKPKMSPGKPKMTIGGKPPIKTYEAKTKQAQNRKAAAAAASANANANSSTDPAQSAPVSKFASGIPNFYKKEETAPGPSPAGSPTKKGTNPSSADPKKPGPPKPSGSGVKRSGSKSAAEAARKALEEEKLRLKVSEQKRIRDQRKKEIELKVQQDKDAETLKALNIKLVPPPVKIPKIPKKTASFSDMIGIPGTGTKEKSSSDSKKSTSRSTKENEKSKEKSLKNKNDAKTDVVITPEQAASASAVPPKERKHRVKVFSSGKSRSLGLLEDMEQTLDKSKAKDKEKDKDAMDIDIPDVDIPNSVLLGTGKPSKRPSLDGLVKPGDAKKPKLDEKEKKRQEKETKASDAKKSKLMESSLFMDALTASTTSTKPSRSKRRTSSTGEKDKDKEKDLLSPTTTAPAAPKSTKGNLKSPTIEEEPVKPVFNFYRDTLTEEEEPKKKSPDQEEPEIDIKIDVNTPDSPDVPITDSFTLGDGEGKLKSALVILRPKDKPKKFVRWREDDVLTQFCYFEMDETERVNVSKPAQAGAQVRNFQEMKSMERSDERKVIVINKRKSLLGVEDKMEEKMEWRPLTIIDFEKEIPEVPIVSREKLVQEEREKGILGVFYFYKSQIPDSPEETPEVLVLNQDDSVTKFIPWDDLPNTNLKKVHLPLVQWEDGPPPGNTNPPDFIQRPPGFTPEIPTNNAASTNVQLPDPFGLAAMMQSQPQFANMDQIAQQQIQAVAAAQLNLWTNNGNPFNMAAGMQPGSDMWNIAAAAAAATTANANAGNNQQAFPNVNANPGMNMNMMGAPAGGFNMNNMNPYSGFNPAFPPPSGMMPPQQQQPQDDFQQFGPGDQGRFNGPPQRGGGRGRPPNDHHNHHNGGDRNRDDREHAGGFRGRGDRDDRDNFRGNYNRDRDNNGRGGRGHYNNRDRDRGGRDDRRGGDRDHRGGAGPGERNRGARTVICKFFKSGFCKVGDKCDFLHPGINGPDRGGGSNRHSRFSSRGDSPPSRSSRFDSPPRNRSDRDRERDRSRERDGDRDRRGSRDKDADAPSENRDTPASPPPPASPTTPVEQNFNQPPSSPVSNQDAALQLADAPKLIPNETEGVVIN